MLDSRFMSIIKSIIYIKMNDITLKNDKDIFVNKDNIIEKLKSVLLTLVEFYRCFLTIASFILLLSRFNNCEKKLTINLLVLNSSSQTLFMSFS